jgi:hypothetical protein
MALDPRIAELEQHLASWNRRRRWRTGLATLLPVGVAAGLGWLAQERIGERERTLEAAFDRLGVSAPAGEAGLPARLAALESELRALRPLPGELSRRVLPDGGLRLLVQRGRADWPPLAAVPGVRLDHLSLEDLFVEVAE